MKQRIFTLIMMLALVFVAGSAKALNDINVYPGGLYQYRVQNVSATSAATATIAYDVPSGIAATISNTAGLSVGATAASITFDVKYGTVAAPAVSGNIIVTVTQGTCTNMITLAVVVLPPPSLTLALTVGSVSCSNVNGLTTDGTADGSVGATENSFAYTVTPEALTGLANFAFTFGLDSYTFGTMQNAKTSGTSTGGTRAGAALGITAATGAQGFTVYYNTVEGGGATVTGSVSTATFTMDAAHGGQTYNCILTPNDVAAVIAPIPTIGAFN